MPAPTHPSDPYVKFLAAPETTPRKARQIYRQALRDVFHLLDLLPVHHTISCRWPEQFEQIVRPAIRAERMEY